MVLDGDESVERRRGDDGRSATAPDGPRRSSLLRDDRGQAIQVGAAILLGFLVLAITLYQVQVVPGQNAEIEYDHSQSVQEDLQDLRNAIANAAARETSEARSVALGTRFPARTIFANPPPARGVLQTEDAGSIAIRNAAVDPDSGYGSDATALLDEDHATERIVYRPSYSEYGSEPTTVIEHAFAYSALRNDVENPLSRQAVVRGDALALTLVDGELRAQGSNTVSVEATTVGGPTDPVPIVPADDARPIEVDLPVSDPDPWNETVGTTYAAGEPDARVAAFDGNDTAATDGGTITLELDRDRYRLRMSLVGVGANATETDRYDVAAPGSDGGTGGGSAAYDVSWRDPSGQTGVEDDGCSADRCVVDGDRVELTAGTSPVADGAAVEYAVSDRSVATVASQSGTTDDVGEAVVTVDVADGASTGDTAYVYASSGSAGDRIELEVNRSDGGSDPGDGGDADVATRVEDLTHQPQNVLRYYASYEVTNAADHDRTAVAFRDLDYGDTIWRNGTSARDTVSVTDPDGGRAGNEFEIEVLALDASGDVIASQTIADASADGRNPDGNQQLGDAESPSITDNSVSDQSNDANGVQYGIDYAAEGGGFGSVELHLVSLDANTGGSDEIADLPASSNETLSTPTGYWANPEFAVTTLVFDEDGVIVDAETVVDTADGTGP